MILAPAGREAAQAAGDRPSSALSKKIGSAETMKQRWMFLMIAALGLVVLGMLLKWPEEKALSREQIIARSIEIYHTSNVHNNTRWLGIQAQQSPCDMWTDQEIISEVKPGKVPYDVFAHGVS
jgi:Rhamnosyl O-methyltransferase/CmcI